VFKGAIVLSCMGLFFIKGELSLKVYKNMHLYLIAIQYVRTCRIYRQLKLVL